MSSLSPYTPRPEQEAAIVEVLESKRHLCRAATGAGKTLIGVEAVLRSKAKITLVIAPINTFAGWRKTFERQSKGKVSPLVIDGTKDGKAAFERLAGRKAGVYLMSWERFRMYDWSNMPLGFVIADEVHRQQNRNSGTHGAVKTTRHAEYALALSATPWGNRIEGAWATLRWLWWGDDEVVGKNQGFWNWVTRHLTTELDQYAGKKITGEQRQGSVWASVPSKSYFPSPYQEAPVIHLIEVELTAYQRKVYDKFEEEAIVWLEENPLIAEGGGVQRMRLREICLAVPSIRDVWKKVPDAEVDNLESKWLRWEWEERENGPYALVEEVYFKDDAKSTKADAIIDQLNDLYAGGEPYPVIMFTHSRKFALMLTARLKAKKFRAEHFVGGMSNEERAYRMDGFGKEFDIMVSTIPAIGTGTDGLQLVCWTEFWISLDDNRVLNEQADGRIPRDGQTRTVQRFIFMAKGTVELEQKGKLEADAAQLDGSFRVQRDIAA